MKNTLGGQFTPQARRRTVQRIGYGAPHVYRPETKPRRSTRSNGDAERGTILPCYRENSFRQQRGIVGLRGRRLRQRFKNGIHNSSSRKSSLWVASRKAASLAFTRKTSLLPQAFQNRQNFFAGRNVTVIVLEVPSQLVGRGQVRAWATVSLYGHAPEVQVSRWVLPLSRIFSCRIWT